MAVACDISSSLICRGRVLKIESRQDAAVCVIEDQTRLLLSRFVGSRVAIGDEIAFAVPTGDEVSTEILITKNSHVASQRFTLGASLGFQTP